MRVIPPDELHRRETWARACATCGKVFGWSKNGDRAICCSRVCVGKLNGKTKNRPIEKKRSYTCGHCGTAFLSYYKNRSYCSRKCSALRRMVEGNPVRWASRTDANQAEIVRALREIGAYVIDTSMLGGGAPDLVVGHQGRTILIEVKNPKTAYGRAGLSAKQIEWHASWRGGPLAVVCDVESALRVVRVGMEQGA